jgi:hypothetical protein
MSDLNYTPQILGQIAQDFARGRVGPVTLQFFEQLFRRVGGSTAATMTEIIALIVAPSTGTPDFDLVPRVEWALGDSLFALAPRLEAETAGLSVDPRREAEAADLSLTPRDEVMGTNFNLGNLWP